MKNLEKINTFKKETLSIALCGAAFITACHGGLKAPTELAVTPESASAFTLAWRDLSEGEEGYRIERLDLDGEWRAVGVAPADAEEFISAGGYAFTDYLHRVVAFRGENESVSEPVSGKTLSLMNQRRGEIIETASARQGEGTFVKLKNGDIALYYSDMVTVSDLAESRVSRKVSKDGGATWGEREPVFAEGGMALFLPSAMRLDTGEIAISYARRVPGEWDSKRVVRISSDEGKTWGDEILVTGGSYDYMTGSHDRFYKLSNGDLIILVHSLEGLYGEKKGEGAYAQSRHFVTDVYGSTDNGRAWERWTATSLDAPINPYNQGEFGLWECAIAEVAEGELYLLGRTSTGWAYESRSTDYGRTWKTPTRSGIRNPLAPPYLKKIPGTDALMLISTPMFGPGKRLLGDRYALALRVSQDGGSTWKNYEELEYHNHDWWYDYPNVLFDGPFMHLSCRSIELTPEKRWGKVNLGYMKLPLAWVVD